MFVFLCELAGRTPAVVLPDGGLARDQQKWVPVLRPIAR
jgi:hypothetical protein